MILEQHYLKCLAQASYLVACERTRIGAIVDPRRDVGLYLERARELDVRIGYVLLTHFHADFLAGHLELAEATGAVICLGARARPEYASLGLAEGSVLRLGDVSIEVLETPGHTPESVCYLVRDGGPLDPAAVLTGDTLFIGDVGRPDLMASVGITADELSRDMYASLREKLAPLPDDTVLYPGHGAGSSCGKNLSEATSCTIGTQRANNWALQEMGIEDFVAILTAGQPPAPAYFPRAARLNQREHATLDKVLGGGPVALPLEDFLARQAAGAQVLDTRGMDDFAAGHLSGAINIGLDGSYALRRARRSPASGPPPHRRAGGPVRGRA